MQGETQAHSTCPTTFRPFYPLLHQELLLPLTLAALACVLQWRGGGLTNPTTPPPPPSPTTTPHRPVVSISTVDVPLRSRTPKARSSTTGPGSSFTSNCSLFFKHTACRISAFVVLYGIAIIALWTEVWGLLPV